MNTARHTRHVCPWWQAYFFDNPLRRLFHSPRRLFADYLVKGMTAVDIGCGMGFFSIGMAKIVGEKGKILAVDVQPQMLSVLRKRARRAGVSHIIDTRPCTQERIGLSVAADFVLFFWSMHEIPDTARLAGEISRMLKPGGFCFVAEPAFHVGEAALTAQVNALTAAGLRQIARPPVTFSRSALLKKTKDNQ